MAAERSSSAIEAKIAHEAAVWMTKRELGMTPAEQDEFFQWLAENPRHGDWLAKRQQTVAGLKKLAQWRPEHSLRPNPDLLAETAVRPAKRRVKALRWIVPLGLAAAACATFMVWVRGRQPAPAISEARPPAVVRKFLEDGSTIDLIQGAAVEVAYTARSRAIRLVQGKAAFNVTRNPDRPFTVDADGVKVRAVGTAFDVDLRARTVEVVVTEGRVQLSAPSIAAPASAQPAAGPPPMPILEAGQRATVSLRQAIAPIIENLAPAEIARQPVWKSRQLEFSDTPLAQVVAEFNADNAVKIVVADPALASIPVGASLRSDNVDGFVRVLEASFGVRAEHRPDGVIVLRRAN